MPGRRRWTIIIVLMSMLMLQWHICDAQSTPATAQANANPKSSARTSLDNQIGTIESCRERMALRLKITSIDESAIKTISDLCNWEISDAYGFAESDARLAAFSLQREQGTIILWIVVAMTAVGLLLAIIQLGMSFVLAIRFKRELVDQAEVRATAKEVVMRSSTIGLALLAVTFAFFLTYVLFVYPIREISPRGSPYFQHESPMPNSSSSNLKKQLLSGVGHLGSPPVPASSVDPPAQQPPVVDPNRHALRRRHPCHPK
jgi:hypothetical protein